MKILQVRFKNLNSLAGEWAIDLTHPSFVSDGIFAITGPTGSGKTTVLDAISLALYGRTPRLGKISKSGNEIMSRRTGECFAEVTFETQTGRFRCHWSQRRARKSPDGELQPPKQEIADADSGDIVDSGIIHVAERVEAATGMDFDRFTRSLLLAQGGFAAFLQAAPDARAPILEQITGTEIYSRISTRVHERLREERENLQRLQAEIGGILTLEPEQVAEIGQALEAALQEESRALAAHAAVGQAITWLKTIDGLKKELAALAEEEERLRSALEIFGPERARLNLALEAASLDGTYANLSAFRQQQATDRAALEAGERVLPELESAVIAQSEALARAERQSVAARKALKDATPMLQKIRSLDQRLADRKKALAEAEAAVKNDTAKINADTLASRKAKEQRDAALKALERIDAYLEEHARDAWLVSGLAGLEEQLNALLSRQQEIFRKEAEHARAGAALAKIRHSLAQIGHEHARRKRRQEELAAASRQAVKDMEELLNGRLLREYRAEKEALLRELALTARIAELEDYRARLEAGKPCPLCGSENHPFASGGIPLPDVVESQIAALDLLIARAEKQEAVIQKLEQDAHAAHEQLAESEKREAVATRDREAAGQTLAGLEQSLATVRAEFGELRQAVAAKLDPLGIAAIPDATLPSLLESLQTRLASWQNHVTQKAEIERQIAAHATTIARIDAAIETRSGAMAEAKTRLDVLAREYTVESDERRRLFGDKTPDAEEHRLYAEAAGAETAEKQAGTRYNELLHKWNSAKANAVALKNRISQRAPELEQLETAFAASLGLKGFTDERRFLDARLSHEQRGEIAAKARALDDRHTELKARQSDREARLSAATARNITGESLEELEARLRAQEDSLKDLRESIAGFRHRLRENELALARAKEGQAALEAHTIECRRWENLHALIGSSDGKKYRNFAQGLTFDLMISYANRQLRRMTDRYLLIRDHAQPLELNVIDNYQAGEIRSTKNLSGGESFLVSLSLALGLSHMSSKNVRVDSLFLDEGFGTLDEESLDMALETLASLQREGKLIGVISHVPAIRERIGTQIRITPRHGGISLVHGPGCGAGGLA